MSDTLVSFLPSILGALLGYFASLLNTYLNRGKMAAETRSVLKDIDEKNTKIQGEQQDQIFELIEQNQKMFNDMRNINESLISERRRSINLEDEVLRYKNASTDYIVKIGVLEKKLTSHDVAIKENGVAIKEIKKKTAPLPKRGEKPSDDSDEPQGQEPV